jgi:hypothetical protein
MANSKFWNVTLATLVCLLAGIFNVTIAAPPDQPTQSAGASETAIDQSDFSNFDTWAHNYIHAPSMAARAASESRGQDLSIKRQAALLHLIQTNPEMALRFEVPQSTKNQLPRSVAEHLEKRVSGRGDFLVLGVLPAAGHEKEVAPIRRIAVIDGKPYEAHVFGARLHQRTQKNVTMQGIAIGNELALEDNATSEAASAQSGGARSTGASAATINSWTLGTKSVLFIRVRFSDQSGEPETLAQAQAQMSGTASFYRENSYNQTDLVTTFPPTFVLPQTQAWYIANGDYYLQEHARNAALAAGYDYLNYDLDAVRWNGGPGNYSGMAIINSRGLWLKSSETYVTNHEFGHNYGLSHANSWNATNDSVYGAGVDEEYGDPFDNMGLVGGPQYHFNAWYKETLSWIAPTDFPTVTSSGTYRIFAHDNAASTGSRGLRVARNAGKSYEVEFRQKFTSNNFLMSGTGIRFINGYVTELLDTTVSALSNKNDSALAIGRTFSDTTNGIHITPIRKGGTVPESLDVVVNLGSFPGNLPPAPSVVSASNTHPAVNATITLNVTASDPNGDPLAYGWDFGNGTFGANASSVTKSWPSAGEYNVRCVVSDMKGGRATKWIIVTVGSPNTLRASGRVTTNSGAPLEGVRVSNGITDTFTDSAGNFSLVQLGRNQSYNFSAVKYDFATVASGFTNPIRMKSSSVTNINFISTPRTYTITGQAIDYIAPVPGVTVSDGTHPAVTTDANGNFTIPNVANGLYNLTATKSGYEWSGGGSYNPFEIEGANRFAQFSRRLYQINGNIYGTTQSVLMNIGDGLHQYQSFMQYTGNFYGMAIPAGTWTIRGTLAGYTVSPRNFVNPLTVPATSYPYRDFDTVPGIAITGTVTENGAGIADVTVTSGTVSVTTDSRGNFVFTNVIDGSYDLVPSKLGYTFSPASRSVTVSGAGVTDNNFEAAFGVPLP